MTTTLAVYKIRIIANACITRYNNREAGDLESIIDANYRSLLPDDRQGVVDYVAQVRPDIPYELEVAL